jgi:surfeit locus 1 family protein
VRFSAQQSLAAIFIVVAAVCIRLGLWQLGRLHERRASNTVAIEQRGRPELALDAAPAGTDSTMMGTSVLATGRYDYSREILIRGQTLDGVPGVHLVTPLVLENGRGAVLVERGFVPAPDALTLPNGDWARDTGRVEVRGLALAISREDGQPITRHGRTSWRRLSLGMLQGTLPYPIRAVYIRPMVGPGRASGFPRVLPPPLLDDGPHLSYALQWFGFAATGITFAGILWLKRGKRDATLP